MTVKELWWKLTDPFVWHVIDPIRFARHRSRLLYLCWRTIRPYRKWWMDGYYGGMTYRLTYFNYLRAILELYFQVHGKMCMGLRFTMDDAARVMNWYPDRYKDVHHETKKKFNELIKQAEEFWQ
jgi:hypothetical protein